MKKYRYIDNQGTFTLDNPELTSYLYYPIANEAGVMSSVTPTLGGDSKMGQNSFLLAPVSSEDLHNNKSSRNYWCNIEGKGIWSATGKSSAQQAEIFQEGKEETKLEAGIMWHQVTRISRKMGIQSEVLSFVPHSKETVELMIVTLKNISNEPLKISPTAGIPLYGRSADNIRDHRHVTSLLHRIQTTEDGIVLNPTLTFDERGHQQNAVVYGVFGGTNCGEKPIGFFPTVEEFIGEGGTFEHPRAIQDKEIAPVDSGVCINGYEAMGGIRFDTITLEPDKEKTYIIVMGYGGSKKELEQYAQKYLAKNQYIQALEATKEYWNQKINVKYQSGISEFDQWMYWVNFQPMLRRIYGCSFLPHHDYGKGGRGWRDLWQDCLALLLMNPDGVREMILDNYGGVRMDGTNATIIGTKQGEFIADRNNITRVWMDHGVWPFLTTQLYIHQSGDLELLLKEQYYFKDLQVLRGEEHDILWQPEEGSRVKTERNEEYKGSILEHILVQHLTAFFDVGEHNHIRLRGADWNDALDMAKERGESVAFTSIYGGNLSQLAELLEGLQKKGIYDISLAKELKMLLVGDSSIYDDIQKKQEILKQYCLSCIHKISGEKFKISCKELASNLRKKAEWIKQHIRDTEWLINSQGKSWYNGYYDNHGRRLEGDHELGVRMMLTSQVFTIMSETATKEQVEKIVQAADTYLYDRSVGGYKLNTNFHEIKTDMGRMYGFAYGQKENGAVFSHMAVMYANALYQRGYAKEGYKVIDSLYQHCANYEVSKIYPGIPEYIGENGRGLYHYLTGAASWLLLTVLTEMFGVKGRYGDLVIEPKLMLAQFDRNNEARIFMEFAGRKLEIIYLNRNKKEYSDYIVEGITIDGVSYNIKEGYGIVKRSYLENLDKKESHEIIVELR